jgi:ABC-type bacteriocin/lantibiotic exporter with double-glycine peptidase domain
LLSQAIEKGGLTIEVPISQGGLLSAGERQLIALARAVLQKTNIIIMDEAMTEIYWCLDDQVSWHITPVLRLTGIHCWRLDLGAFLLG